MKRLILFVLLFVMGSSFRLHAAPQQVFVAYVDGTVDLGMAPYIRRVINEAENSGASAIIFKINTFGGRVDAATQIKDAILNSKIKTIAFIDKRAISAGALIALSCQRIVMSPGSAMGASTVVDEQGKKQSEKYQSYMRSEMRSTAQKNGRRPDIAEAMVDERLTVEGLDDSTKLVTLTADEARKYGMSDTTASSVESVLNIYNLQKAEVNYRDTNWAEQVVRLINNPLVSSILIMIGLVGLFVEIKTPGWGVPGTVALIALGLFFGTGYILELANAIEIIVFVVGVILLVLEIFVIPGFGIAGILGIIMIMAGLFLGLISDFPLLEASSLRVAIIQLAAAFVSGLAIILLLTKYLPKSQHFDRLILHHHESSSEGYASNPQLSDLLGQQGTTLTVLRPSGTAVFNDRRIDVVTEGGYIEKDRAVTVVKVEGYRIIVREI